MNDTELYIGERLASVIPLYKNTNERVKNRSDQADST